MSKKHKKKLIAAAIAVATVAVVGATMLARHPKVDNTVYMSPSQTKTSNCVANAGIEDKACTPGAVIASAAKAQICKPGYSSSVRNVPESEKRQVYAEYGIATHTTGQYEVDHLISLELGGSNDISNLWPELADPTPGFHQKDKVENYLHKQVCDGKLSLKQAQQEIATDWLQVYETSLAH
ncbi:MAG TPA: HNH endonuclease signature motif containing protein [Patescibacteria group bacterium]|nr:HNH endonuclease signature motif containing protein [Patescibacteria group bacterium]